MHRDYADLRNRVTISLFGEQIARETDTVLGNIVAVQAKNPGAQTVAQAIIQRFGHN